MVLNMLGHRRARFSLVVTVAVFIAYLPIAAKSEQCKGRVVLTLNTTQATGTLASNNVDERYPELTSCEWFLIGPEDGTIKLSFNRFETECLYDYVFVRDGDNQQSPLLGAFSGSTLPSDIVATSGSMLVHLYSDTNYVLNGFNATYELLEDCPNSCSSQGNCDGRRCVCNPGFEGVDCSLPKCPSNCGANGVCSSSGEYCVCNLGYSGDDCSQGPASVDEFFTVTPSDNNILAPRASHASCLVGTDIWVHGGYSMSQSLSDLLKFDSVSREWSMVAPVGSLPTGRFDHTMTELEGFLYIFGGVLAELNVTGQLIPPSANADDLTNEFWRFDISGSSWQKIDTSFPLPPLAGHAAAIVDRAMIVVGGRTVGEEFLSRNVYRYDIDGGTWSILETSGAPATQVVGHSMVYYEAGNLLLVYGGYRATIRFASPGLGLRDNTLYGFNPTTGHWTKLNPTNADRIPYLARHSAVLLDNRMIIYGGDRHTHYVDETCYSDTIFSYDLDCNSWNVFNASLTYRPELPRGRVAHSAFAIGDYMFVVGGMSGTTLSDVVGYMPPVSWCSTQGSEDSCTNSPECAWCAPQPATTTTTTTTTPPTTTTTTTTPLPTPSSSVVDTMSSTSFSSPQATSSAFPSATPSPIPPKIIQQCFPNDTISAPTNVELLQHTEATCGVNATGMWVDGECQFRCAGYATCKSCASDSDCTWCGSSASCVSTNPLPAGMLGGEANTCSDASSKVTEEPECVKLGPQQRGFSFFDTTTKRPALTSGFQSSDLFLDVTSHKILSSLSFSETVTSYPLFGGTFEPTVRGNYVFHISMSAPGTVAIYTGGVVAPTVARRRRASEAISLITFAIVPVAGQKMETTQFLDTGEVYTLVGTTTNPLGGRAFSVAIEWTPPGETRVAISAPVGRPWASLNCTRHTVEGCATCTSDFSCGWCDGNCVDRSSASSCSSTMLTDSETCDAAFSCSYHTSCDSCTSSVEQPCQWRNGNCFDMGSNPTGVTNSSLCPVPCTERKNCADCQEEDDYGLCAWCPSTNSCFSWATYTYAYAFGQCSEWFHRTGSSPPNCPSCEAHVSCGECLAAPNCGWCYDEDDSDVGSCKAGGFDGPSTTCTFVEEKIVSANTSHPVCAAPANSTAPSWNCTVEVSTDRNWVFDLCPDKDECALGTAECGPRSNCSNTYGSYECICEENWESSGKDAGRISNPCTAVCSNCVNGNCDLPEVCNCHPGWQGSNCTVDCGCNQHAVCGSTFGDCAVCLHNTTGPACGECLDGFFGNATAGGDCASCSCNGHGDPSKGICDDLTGICECLDHTTGPNCERCEAGYYGDPTNGGLCYASCREDERGIFTNDWNNRVLITDLEGGIIFGTDEINPGAPTSLTYKNMETCQWLLQAPNTSYTITLTFETFDTECGFDFLHVFDGPTPYVTPGSHLLGAFSGYNLPMPIESKTGYMLLNFFADESFTLSGARAVFTMDYCASGCVNGNCVDGTCSCDAGFTGRDCSDPICPNNCSGNGTCTATGCLCDNGFAGTDCLLQVQTDNWYQPGRQSVTPPARSGHSTVYSTTTDDMIVFGGYNQESVLKDVWILSSSQDWSKLSTTGGDNLKGRHLHTSVLYESGGQRRMIVFGGAIDDLEYSSEVWELNLDTAVWTFIDYTSPNMEIPSVIAHSATLVGTRMYVFGGFTEEYNGLFSALYYLDIDTQVWTVVNDATGINPDPTYAHSAVYYPPDNSIVFFGGRYQVSFSSGFVANRTSSVRTFDLDTKRWDVVATNVPDCAMLDDDDCLARWGHSAAVVNNRMYVFGGNPFTHVNQIFRDRLPNSLYAHSARDVCHSQDLLVFDLECNNWIAATKLDRPRTPLQRFEHTVTARKDGVVTVLGGFSGRPLSDVHDYVVPASYCASLTTEGACVTDTKCGWSLNQTICEELTSIPPTRNQNDTVEGVCLKTEPPACADRTVATKNAFDLCRVCNSDDQCDLCSGSNSQCCDDETGGTPDDSCIGKCSAAITCEDCSRLGCTWSSSSLVCLNPPSPAQATAIESCPAPCSTFTSCSTCGAQRDCSWCESLGTCFPYFIYTSELSEGQCFRYGSRSGLSPSCPADCSFSTCDRCLQEPRCGWCGVPDPTGEGQCELGVASGPGLFAPLNTSACAAWDSTLMDNTPTAIEPTEYFSTVQNKTVNGTFEWSYFSCPDIDECALGTDTCSSNSTCVNENPNLIPDSIGFRCVCDQNYTLADDKVTCEPICDTYGCVEGQGRCVLPDICQCELGYTGRNCSQDCGCNGHSYCDIGGVGVCDECQENTEGQFCETCQPGYHGNATFKGQCTSCNVTCNLHSSTCLQDIPQNSSQAVCSDCKDNTMGSYCELCSPGYFYEPSIIDKSNGFVSPAEYLALQEDLFSVCLPCPCNGHGNTCNPNTGDECECEDNTETDYNECSSSGRCYEVQCNLCQTAIEFGGTTLIQEGKPVDGQMCYLKMDPETVVNASIKHQELHLYHIDPRFTNVDIRIVVETNSGTGRNESVKFYLSRERNLTKGDNGKPDFLVTPQTTEIVTGKSTVKLNSGDYNFLSEELDIVIEGISPDEASYRLYILQPVVTIDLFVFFSVFFCSFFLFMAAVIVVVKVRAHMEDIQNANEEALQMQRMAERPMAKCVVIFGPDVITGSLAVAVAEAQSQGKLPALPVAAQETSDGKAAVMSFLVEVPSATSHRNLYIGSALLQPHSESNTGAGRKLSKRKSSTRTSQT